MTPLETFMKEAEKNVEMALNYQSWGNAADTLKRDLPTALEIIRVLSEALTDISGVAKSSYREGDHAYQFEICAREYLARANEIAKRGRV